MTLQTGNPSPDLEVRRRRGVPGAVVATLLVIIVAFAGWVIIDHTTTSGVDDAGRAQQSQMMDVIRANQDATNAQDAEAMYATMTRDFIWSTGAVPPDQFLGGLNAVTYINITVDSDPAVQETFNGDPIYYDSLVVAIPTQRVEGGNATYGTYTYTLRDVDGQLKIARMVWAEG